MWRFIPRERGRAKPSPSKLCSNTCEIVRGCRNHAERKNTHEARNEGRYSRPGGHAACSCPPGKQDASTRYGLRTCRVLFDLFFEPSKIKTYTATASARWLAVMPQSINTDFVFETLPTANWRYVYYKRVYLNTCWRGRPYQTDTRGCCATSCRRKWANSFAVRKQRLLQPRYMAPASEQAIPTL